MVDVPDVHCHLDQIDAPERAVEEALGRGVRPIFAVGMHRASSEHCLRLRQQYPGDVLAAIGLHPSVIPALNATQLREELAFVEATLAGADALGEVGLDYRDALDETQRLRQRQAFASQLAWAARWRKPVNAHCRRAERDIMALATSFVQRTGLGINLHWFTHSKKLARRCAARDIFISAGPSILSSTTQAAVARLVDDDWLLIETDSPVEYEAGPARPVWARRVAEHLALLRHESFDELATRLQANLQRYLNGRRPAPPLSVGQSRD